MFSGDKSIHHRSVVKIAEFRIKAMHRGHHLAPLYKINAFISYGRPPEEPWGAVDHTALYDL